MLCCAAAVVQVREANQMVEEMMLLANCTVAEQTLSHFPALSLLRRHPTPPPKHFELLLRAAVAVGLSIDPSTSKVGGWPWRRVVVFSAKQAVGPLVCMFFGLEGGLESPRLPLHQRRAARHLACAQPVWLPPPHSLQNPTPCSLAVYAHPVPYGI
jgi:hypothetical protein